jgi:AraC family transcriptional regulator
VPPSVVTLTRSDEDYSLTSIVCELNAEPVLELFDSLPPLNDQHLLASLDIQDARVRLLLLRPAEEALHTRIASEILVESIATQLGVELFRLGTPLAGDRTRCGLLTRQLRLIDDRLKQAGAAPSLVALAAQCRVSVRHLSRGIRAAGVARLGGAGR